MKNARHSRKRLRALGFTLLELMIVVVLIGALMAIVTLSVRSLSGVKIKEEIMRIAGLTSEVYAKAAISGITHRINFDFEDNSYWVEVKEGNAGESIPELGYDELIVELAKKKLDGGEILVPKFKPVEGMLGEKYKLPKDIVLYGAWTEVMEEVSRSGLVSIYFFSGGYTQTSFVSIAEKGNEASSSLYISLSPLTGAVSTNFGEPETSSLLDSEGEKQL